MTIADQARHLAERMLYPQKITTLGRTEYLNQYGANCPHCGSDNVDYGSFDFDDGSIYQRAQCGNCPRAWYDVYTLTNVVDPYGED